MAQLNRISLVSLLALGLAMPAMAQGQPTPQAPPEEDQPNARGRDVVVVTAQKREETVQDIAVAVTAITSELRDEIGLTTVQDYTNFAPGLTYSTASDRLGMRGVTRTSNNFGIRSGISNYVDGVYFSSAIPASREPIFVERVEVVRGPQGTLYGRDSIGGALNVITKRPTEEFEGQVNLNYGDYGTIGVAGTVAGPITDWMRYRAGYSRQATNEGYLTNYAGLETEGGRKNDTYYEGQLEFDIGDRLDLWIRAGSLNWDVREGAPGGRTGVEDPYPYQTIFFNSTADVGPNGYFGLQDPARTQVGIQNTNPSITDRWGFNTDFTNYAKLSPTSELAVEAVWHANSFDIKYLGGYVWYNYLLRQDQDNTPIKRFVAGGQTYHTERVSDYIENRGWFSNEINFLSTWEGPLQVVSGLYHYQENYNQLVFVSNVTSPGGPILRTSDIAAYFAPGFTNFAPELPTNTGYTSSSGAPSGASLAFHTNNQAVNNAYGAFVQADYQLNDQLKFTAGVRYSKDIMDGREYARFVSHYVVRAALGAPPAAGGIGPAAALLPPRIDATPTLGGPDPTTISASNPCGLAGQGVLNTNVTTANGIVAANNPTGCSPTDSRATDRTRYGIYTDPVTGNAYRDLYAEFEEVTGVLGVDWTPDDDTLIYGKYNRGYKPGGLGCAAVFCAMIVTPYTDKELVDAFELGYKKTWPDWNLTTNATLFYYDYQGYQVPNLVVPPDPGGGAVRPAAYSTYVNLPETKTTGFELETIWYPTDNLRFMLNYGYTNPEIGDTQPLVHAFDLFALDPAAQPLGPPATTPAACAAPAFSIPGTGPATCRGEQAQNLNGNILPFSPKNKIALNGTYTWDFEDGATLDASLSYFWQDISFSSIFNRSYTKVPSWDQTDARLSWTSADGNLSLIGFIKNVFDDIVYDSRGASLREGGNNQISPTECNTSAATTASAFGARSAQSCYTIGETLRPPRTVGAELQIRF
jgi:iron complex outermembrane receptor protein